MHSLYPCDFMNYRVLTIVEVIIRLGCKLTSVFFSLDQLFKAVIGGNPGMLGKEGGRLFDI